MSAELSFYAKFLILGATVEIENDDKKTKENNTTKEAKETKETKETNVASNEKGNAAAPEGVAAKEVRFTVPENNKSNQTELNDTIQQISEFLANQRMSEISDSDWTIVNQTQIKENSKFPV